jgi:hypothetical protein
MSHTGLGGISDLVRRTRRTIELRVALRQVQAFLTGLTSDVCVCWDLDNTLVDSGVLLRAGRTLEEAVVDAYPVSNMLDFYRAMSQGLPDADHFFLSARPRSMRVDTFGWCERYGVAAVGGNVCLVPYAALKPRIWAELARGSRLVIVDDLSFNHEAAHISLYDELIREAKLTAWSYVGLGEITEIASDRGAIETVVGRTIAALGSIALQETDTRPDLGDKARQPRGAT